MLEEIYDIAKIHPFKVKGVYGFGSRIYGTASNGSDSDFIIVGNASSPEVEYSNDRFNVHVIVPDLFEKYVRDNHIKAAECLFAPEWAKLKEYPIEWVYKEASFRHNISHTVSNSWVKCKKKLAQGDYYIGVKSIFHSLRIVDFGIQIAKTGRIEDFSSSNWIWEEIKSKTWTWEELDEKWRPLRNERSTEFRTLTSKI